MFWSQKFFASTFFLGNDDMRRSLRGFAYIAGVKDELLSTNDVVPNTILLTFIPYHINQNMYAESLC